VTTPARATDPAVDEVRRRARRRLVGAVVLALGAAVVVPMLLEHEPRPLGEDVSVRIPPVDEGKFVNRLNAPPPAPPGAAEAKAPPAAAVPPASAPAAAPSPAAAPTEAPGVSAAPPAAAEAAAPAPAAAKDAPASGKRSLAEAEQRVLTPGSKPITQPAAAAPPAASPSVAAKPAAEPKPAPARPAAEAKAPAAKAAAGDKPAFAVQLAAFADDKGANALANRLKRAGFSAYTEPLATSRGTLWRVRVGPFATRDAADAARGKLKAAGQNGIVTPVR
jgi:DedD protein